MKKLPLFIVVFLTALAIIDPTSAFAGDKDKKKKPERFDPLISSVSEDSITITKGDSTQTYKITERTQIQVRGQKGTVADLEAGMKATVTIGMQSDSAGFINAVDGPPRKKDDKKKK